MEVTLIEVLQEKDDRICKIAPEATALEAAKMMTDQRVGSLLVMKEEKLLGVLSERDILTRVVAAGVEPSDIQVYKVMSKDMVVVKPSISVRDAMKVVTEKRVRHLPVIKKGRLIGVVSNGDLTRKIIAEDQGHITTLYDYIYGTYPG